jgi:hypothetical protein
LHGNFPVKCGASVGIYNLCRSLGDTTP